jgi:hypothetical protein
VRDHPIHQLIRVPCVIHHSDPGPVDEYGDHPISVVTDTTERCYVAQQARGEADEVEHERWTIYLLPGVLIDANDSVTAHGMTLEVFGNPWVVIDPVTGYETHIEATALRRI